MKLMVTGSRSLPESVRDDFYTLMSYWSIPAETVTVIHGACPTGADLYAAEWCEKMRDRGVVEDPHAPDPEHGFPQAFHIRNQEMVDLMPDRVLAFPGTGNGTHSTIKKARLRGLEIVIYGVDDTGQLVRIS